jgi:hypothetical protein
VQNLWTHLLQLRELLRRNFAQYARLKSYNGTRLFLTICIAVFFGTVLEGQVSGADAVMQAVMQATVVASAAASGIAPQQPFVSGNATQRCSQTQGDNTFTYNGILNLTGVQYSSVMFIGVWRNAL